ncbi:hypothetical protein ABH935_002690 [Catenulispora sp. GAS73]|uniref:hypothetical protein n=1 Tax=Catenulispora sp. GAS73 TaxID=3156269 RepID=UPI00351320AA
MHWSVIVPLLVTVGVAAAGYLATYATNLRLERRKDQLARVNRQLSELYGPLYAQSEAVGRAWRKYVARYGIPWQGSAGGNVTASAEEAATWRLWVSTVFMPLNRRMVETIVSHADLLLEERVPEPLLALCAHVACYEPILATWAQDGFSSVSSADHVSVAGDFPDADVSNYLQTSFQTLKREQSRLLALLQHQPALVSEGSRG